MNSPIGKQTAGSVRTDGTTVVGSEGLGSGSGTVDDDGAEVEGSPVRTSGWSGNGGDLAVELS
ncbi:hypothetical protein VPNG_05371 [Cytospora leucostoma]|uniref:Uncharacterized protein n=1 Tax=Cytospora leucostoma TaxID=1230097 RepID=A0A423X4F1_9PEZI|nr:hypothetical protein VPNG_05371 [Cytospora leucostoma]